MSQGPERLVDADGEPLPPLFEPDPEPEDRDQAWVLGIAVGDFFYRRKKRGRRLLIPIRSRCEFVVLYDRQIGGLVALVHHQAEHGPITDHQILSREQVEALILADETVFQDPVLVGRTLETAAKVRGGASKSRIFLEDVAVVERGGDPETRVPQPDQSFLLGLTPTKIPRKDEI